MSQVHVLNGDALLDQFPEFLPGEKLVMRECLIEGPVNSPSLDAFYKDRIAFLKFEYKATEEKYQTSTIEEFEKLTQLPNDVDINLWFEQDLFCQANLWFICAYLILHKKSNPVYLIMPRSFSSYGFGALNSDRITRCFMMKENRFFTLKSLQPYGSFTDLVKPKIFGN